MGAILEKPGIVVSNTSLTNKLWLMKVKVEGIGKKLLPGQFVHILIPGMEGHILPVSYTHLTLPTN